MRRYALALGLMAVTVLSGCAKMHLPKMKRINLDAPLDERFNSPAWKQHVEECTEKHPGYNPMTNTYPDSRGRMKLC